MSTKKPTRKAKEYIDPLLYEEGIITKKDGMKPFFKDTNKVFVIAANSKRYAHKKGTVVMTIAQLKANGKIPISKMKALSGVPAKAAKKVVRKKTVKKAK